MIWSDIFFTYKSWQTISFARKPQGRNRVCVLEGRSRVFIAVDSDWRCVLPIQEVRYPYEARYPLNLPQPFAENTGATHIRRATHTATEPNNFVFAFDFELKRLQPLANRFLIIAQWFLKDFLVFFEVGKQALLEEKYINPMFIANSILRVLKDIVTV